MRPLLPIILLAGAQGLSGCYISDSHPFRAPLPPPTSRAVVVPAPPPGAEELGMVAGVGGTFTTDKACERRLVEEAEKIGADALVVWQYGGNFLAANCHGVAYRTAKSGTTTTTSGTAPK